MMHSQWFSARIRDFSMISHSKKQAESQDILGRPRRFRAEAASRTTLLRGISFSRTYEGGGCIAAPRYVSVAV
jgi:hypothetical protein